MKMKTRDGIVRLVLALIIASFLPVFLSSAQAVDYPFSDNMEGAVNWAVDPPWALIDNDAHSPIHCRTDSPGDYYDNNIDISLTLATSVNLSAAENPQLKFWHKYQIEPGYDFGYVEISTDGGGSWVTLASYSGFSGITSMSAEEAAPQKDDTGIPCPDKALWEREVATAEAGEQWVWDQIDLTGYAGESNVLIRFRLETDKTIVMDGWHIDDVSISDLPHPVTLFEPSNPGCTSLDLSWTQNLDPGFASYNIYRSTAPGADLNSELVTTITDQATTEYTDTGLQPETTYFYRVYVVDNYDIYAGSKEENGTTLSCGFPFFHDFESGIGDWVLDAPWALTDEDAYGGTWCLTDSPGEDYANNIDKSARITINLGGSARPLLTFWHRYSFESYCDFGYVEISIDEGATWKKLFFVTGLSDTNWMQERIDLTEYAGIEIDLRFHIVTDGSVTSDGWYIDDVAITENTATLDYPFSDDMEATESENNWIKSTWRRNTLDSYSGSYSITESPDGDHVNYVYTGLTLAGTIDLTTSLNPQLTFWHRYRLGYSSYARVYISPNGGRDWIKIWEAGNNATQNEWTRLQLDLSPYMGSSEAVIRFQVEDTSSSSNYYGWFIDDVELHDAPVNVVLAQPANITEHTMDLSWSKNIDPDFVQYEVYRSTSPGVTRSSTLITTITDQAQTSYTDSDIPLPNNAYYYKVFILDSEGLYNQGSNEKSATTLTGIVPGEFPFSDDMENGDRWGNDFPWALIDEDAYSGAYCWADSPGGDYENNEDKSIRTIIDLGGSARPLLTFWHRYSFQTYCDFGYVEISIDEGATWKKLFFVTGLSDTNWMQERIDLTEYAGIEIDLRFHIVTDGSVTSDGWYIDDVAITENTATLDYPFSDDMEATESENNWIKSTWRRNTLDSYSGSYSITESPDGDHVNYVYTGLTLAGTIDLTTSLNPQLTFWHRYRLGYSSYARVYISPNGGRDWIKIWEAGNNAIQNEWTRLQFDLTPYMGSSEAVIRFQVEDTSSSSNYDGWFIDDVSIDEEGGYPYAEIRIEPDIESLLVDECFQFEAYDENDNRITESVGWAVRGAIGTIDDNGLFCAAGIGIGAVAASGDGGISDISRIIEVVGPGGGTTQIEQGNLFSSDSGMPPDDCMFFNAYIIARPDEILTQSSPGCGYGSGVWQVNMGNFPTGWSAGDTLHIDFIDKCNGEEGALEYTLANGGQSHNVTLSPISFDLTTTLTTNVNVVTLLKDSGITNAEELAQALPNAIEVACWSAGDQAYIGHSKGSPLMNFDVLPGYPYFVTVTADGTWTPTGTVPDPWPTFDLVTTGMTNVNMIGMSLDMLRITKAEEVGHMILHAAEIGRWDIQNQAYEFHTYGTPLFNFDVKPALPYFVTVTEESQWIAANGVSCAQMMGVPQNEGGYVYNSDSTVPEDGDIEFESYILGREDELLTEGSPGCGYGSGYWQVNIGNFPSGWDAGDILHIEFMNTANGEIGSLDIILEYGGQMNDVTFSAPPCPGDFDEDFNVDGSDLAVFVEGGGGSITLEEFAADFGRTDCFN
jgi:hypothetical protein